jgi:cellulose synthase/poly-beta-1,6-N-acetylglucosamine synthase-like glycosyltransferase
MMGRLIFFFAFALLCGSVFFSLLGKPPWSWLAGFCYIIYDTGLIAFVALTMGRFLKTYSPHPATQTLPSICVVIPAHNEEKILPRCLEALGHQSLPPEKIWIIDDGSSDGTFAYLQEKYDLETEAETWVSSRHTRISVLKKSQTGKADSLNVVLAKIESELTVTIDADTILEPEALKELASSFAERPHLQASGGVLVPVPGSALELFQRFEYIRAFLTRQAWAEKNCLVLVSGAFAAYRTSTLKAAGGYFVESLVEDYELTHRLYTYGRQNNIPIEIGVCPKALAHTECPSSIAQFLRQRQRWFGGFLQTQWSYRYLLGDKSYKNLGILMLPIKSIDMLQPLFGLIALGGLLRFILFQGSLNLWIAAALVLKLMIDFVYHFYCLSMYNTWIQKKVPLRFWFQSIAITLGEPLFFQPLRHFGALRGWLVFLRKQRQWRSD